MSKGFSKRLLEKLQKKTNTKIDAKQIEGLAGKVNKNDLNNEEKMLGLIREVSKLANIPMSKEKEEKIIKYLKKNNIQDADMMSLLSILNKKLD